jgi:hypothetical protein
MSGRSTSRSTSSYRPTNSSVSSYSRPTSSYRPTNSSVSSYSRPSSSTSKQSYTPSKPTYTPPQVQTQPQSQNPGFFSNMWQGFGLGAGQAIAHNIFRSDPIVKHTYENAPSQIQINQDIKLPEEFVQCMKDNNNDKELCKLFLE